MSPSVTEGILDDSVQHPLPLLIHEVPLLTTYCVPDFQAPGYEVGQEMISIFKELIV